MSASTSFSAKWRTKGSPLGRLRFSCLTRDDKLHGKYMSYTREIADKMQESIHPDKLLAGTPG